VQPDAIDIRRRLRFERTDAPHTFCTTLAPELVYFEGHFDGFPLLPAVVQLSRIVMPLVRLEHPDLGPLHKLRRARFRKPLQPNAKIVVSLGRSAERVSFEIRLEGEVAASGTLEFHATAAPT
jgi:3-hydroxymyristoyl/3-hydroxydecanoyl-(acyl carrier protein) dehydratase